MRSIYSMPTIVIFCEGSGIATARALIEAEASVGSLNFPLRQSVRLYYRASPGPLHLVSADHITLLQLSRPDCID